MFGNNGSRNRTLGALVASMLAIGMALGTTATADDGGQITASELTQDGYPFPGDIASDADHQELANFAWRMFIAANQIAGGTRGDASSSTNFVDSGSTSSVSRPLVWESFYHRSEAYPYYSGSKPAKPSSSTSQAPTYYFKTITVKSGQWNNLDENNQIGQNTLFFPKGSPHPGDPSEDSQVLFQAKVNATELNYVWPFTSVPQGFNFPTTSPGTIEVKSAWRLASDIGDTSRYHTAMANYYTGDESNPTVQTAEFALLALHIIIKTANHPDFIFMTFEQIDSLTDANGNSTGLYYIPSYTVLQYLESDGKTPDPNQSPSATYTGAYTTIKPTTMATDGKSTTPLPSGGVVPTYTTVIQPKTISEDAVNVNNHVHGLLPQGNVWQYYALKGVQSLDSTTTGSGSSQVGDPTALDYYLANIVVESSQPGIQLFKGGAPGPNPVNNATYLQPILDGTNLTTPSGTNVTIGGCQGCHGVAQQKGEDFSFLVSGGLGTPGFSPDTLEEGRSVTRIKTLTAASPRKVTPIQ